jgi:hypothetical protein
MTGISNAFEAQDAGGYWLDVSDEAIAWRCERFRVREIERAKAARFNLEATASIWENWSDAAAKWAVALREFGALGGKCEYWCGVPHSHSAIPLTFALYKPDGTPLPCRYRLKDIKAAIAVLRAERAEFLAARRTARKAELPK